MKLTNEEIIKREEEVKLLIDDLSNMFSVEEDDEESPLHHFLTHKSHKNTVENFGATLSTTTSVLQLLYTRNTDVIRGESESVNEILHTVDRIVELLCIKPMERKDLKRLITDISLIDHTFYSIAESVDDKVARNMIYLSYAFLSFVYPSLDAPYSSFSKWIKDVYASVGSLNEKMEMLRLICMINLVIPKLQLEDSDVDASDKAIREIVSELKED